MAGSEVTIAVVTFFGLVAVAFVFLQLFRVWRRSIAESITEHFGIRWAEAELTEWKTKNPDKDFSHPEAQEIIRRCIWKMNRYKDENPDIDAEEDIARLIKMLN